MKVFSILLLILGVSSSAHADLSEPAREIRDVSYLSDPEMVMRVGTAKIVIADYGLLRADFSELRSFSNEQIDEWLLKNAGLISRAQVLQSDVNTPIQTDGGTHRAYRPPEYNRALVFTVEGGGGLIDGKGFGSMNPKQGDHSNGLATLGEVLREYTYQKLVQSLFDHSRTGLQTVGSYAVIDWGFDVVHADQFRSRAGAILRQAHKRVANYASLFDDQTTKKIEVVLRNYGITSAGAYRNKSDVDRLNIQGSEDKAILDFGAFLAVSEFNRPAYGFYGEQEVIDVLEAVVQQPHPKYRVPLSIWGTTRTGKEDPKMDNVWIWAHELADKIASGTVSRADVKTEMGNLLTPVQKRLRANPLTKTCADVMNLPPSIFDPVQPSGFRAKLRSFFK